ncbi:MAG: hypothetical protein ABS30_06180 [OM182 bacterium BACL3 MAG-120924-bin41]|uniref:Uncharacterized protein n=1 Tax=OM182 bacterium BACL3 MAG-120924-bin41 TaxID=1655632 RepID=A0A0R2X346_9GAMM|nr:MAG: hypothetical protein ABS30_06180 [OM182 bacterium BACL3 MAG-120924-bin41]
MAEALQGIHYGVCADRCQNPVVLSPLALQKLSLQREALILTQRELAASLATTQRASADVFIDAQLIELDTLAALLK